MRLRFPEIPDNSKTGKIKFIKRLKDALIASKFDVKFTDGNDYDLLLTLFRPSKLGYKKKVVARIDGIYYNTWNDDRNKLIASHIAQCHGIIYQSEFCKQCVYTFIGRKKLKKDVKEVTILNGCDIRSAEKAASEYRYNAICCAKWRRHKRLKETIELAVSIDDLCLWVAGEPDYKISHPRVKYLGFIDQNEMARYHALADVMIHLSAYDPCPNSVAEAIAMGVPVLCTRSGGTPELVRSNGVISKADKPFNYKPIVLDNPPKPNMDVLRQDLISILKRPTKVNTDLIDIKHVAKSYYKMFKLVLEK